MAAVREVGQVVAGVGLGEPLAPVVGGIEDRGEPSGLLLVGPPGDDHRPDLPQAVGVEQPRRAVLGHHLRVDDALHGGGARTPVLLRPAHRRPAAAVEQALPGGPAVLGLLAGQRGVVGQLLAGQERAGGTRRARRAARRGTPRPRVPVRSPRAGRLAAAPSNADADVSHSAGRAGHLHCRQHQRCHSGGGLWISRSMTNNSPCRTWLGGRWGRWGRHLAPTGRRSLRASAPTCGTRWVADGMDGTVGARRRGRAAWRCASSSSRWAGSRCPVRSSRRR